MKTARLRVVGAVGQELQREERVRRAALAQVQLDRVGGPTSPFVADVTKSSAKRPITPSRGEPLADLRRLARDHGRVVRVGGEAAAEVALPARPAEQLVVRRQQLELAERRDPQLDARAPELLAR